MESVIGGATSIAIVAAPNASPVVAHNDYGILEVFMIGRDKQLYYMLPEVDKTWHSLGGDNYSTNLKMAHY